MTFLALTSQLWVARMRNQPELRANSGARTAMMRRLGPIGLMKRAATLGLVVLAMSICVQRPASAARVCPRAATRTEISSQLEHIRSLVLQADWQSAERFLDRLDGLLTCTETPVVGRWLAQVFFLEAVVAWEQGRPDASGPLFRDAVGAYRMFEWDTGLVPPRENSELYKAFRDAKAAVLVRSAPASFVVARGDRYGLVYIDGQGYEASSGETHFIRPGRHIVQFQLGDNRFAGGLEVFTGGGAPLVIEAPRSVLPWDKSVQVAGAFLWFPSPLMAVSRGGLGVDIAVDMTKEHFRARSFAGIYPARFPSGEGELLEAEVTGDLGVPVVRAGGAVYRMFGSDPEASRVVPAVGVAGGAVFAPYGLVSCCGDAGAVPRVFLAPVIGGFLSSRLEVRVRIPVVALTVALEAGYALTARWGEVGVGGDTPGERVLGTPLVGGTAMAGYTF